MKSRILITTIAFFVAMTLFMLPILNQHHHITHETEETTVDHRHAGPLSSPTIFDEFTISTWVCILIVTMVLGLCSLLRSTKRMLNSRTEPALSAEDYEMAEEVSAVDDVADWWKRGESAPDWSPNAD